MSDANPSTSDYYLDHAIAFIDILGFSSHVRRTKHNAHFAENIAQALRTIKNYGRDAQDGFLSVSTFSDSIVISTPMRGKPSLIVFEPFSSLFSAVLELTNILLKQGIIIRGAIAINKLYHEDGVLFGPAMLCATHLEKNVATFPRVIVAEEILDFPSDQVRHNQHLPDGHPLKNFVAFMPLHIYCRRDADGKLFIDFLRMSHKDKGRTLPSEQLSTFLSETRSTILAGFQQCAEETDAQQRKRNEDKWRWLAKYFNGAACDRGCADLIIPSQTIDFENFSFI